MEAAMLYVFWLSVPMALYELWFTPPKALAPSKVAKPLVDQDR
jgi:hypothetical protein